MSDRVLLAFASLLAIAAGVGRGAEIGSAIPLLLIAAALGVAAIGLGTRRRIERSSR